MPWAFENERVMNTPASSCVKGAAVFALASWT
jgi:hypothetical protein